MFIAIEGADGCGKTTLCPILAEKLGATTYATPPQKYLALRERVDKSASTEEHYRFYRDGIYDASDEIGIILAGGRRIVSDRAMGVSVSINHFHSIVLPTLTVILALNFEVQIERMLHRGLTVGDRRVLDKQREISILFYKNALEFNLPFVVIDTGRFSPEACAGIVVAAIGVATW